MENLIIGYSAFLFILGAISVFIFSSIFLIILRGFGLRQLIKNNNLGEEKVILGFIPIISDYMLDEIINGKKTFKENTLGSLTFFTGILSVLFGVFSIIYSVLYLILCHKFFKETSPNNYIILNIFNVITFGSLSYIYIYIKRNHIFKYNLDGYFNDKNDFEPETINLSK